MKEVDVIPRKDVEKRYRWKVKAHCHATQSVNTVEIVQHPPYRPQCPIFSSLSVRSRVTREEYLVENQPADDRNDFDGSRIRSFLRSVSKILLQSFFFFFKYLRFCENFFFFNSHCGEFGYSVNVGDVKMKILRQEVLLIR